MKFNVLSVVLLMVSLSVSCVSSTDVASDEKKSFGSDELKIGDYFYSDGTWSDGGLRLIGEDGNFHVQDPKPMPLEGKEVIGIVFSTDTLRMGDDEKDALRSKGIQPHGLALAVNNLNGSEAMYWGGWGTNRSHPETEPSMEDCYNDISGLENSDLGLSLDKDRIIFHSLVRLCELNESDSLAGREVARSRWFVPSVGQWWDILQNLGGVKELMLEENRKCHLRGAHFFQVEPGICDRLNSWMTCIPDTSKDRFGDVYDHYWTSSQFNPYRQRYVGLINSPGYLYLDWNSVGFRHKVRCVFAF